MFRFLLLSLPLTVFSLQDSKFNLSKFLRTGNTDEPAKEEEEKKDSPAGLAAIEAETKATKSMTETSLLSLSQLSQSMQTLTEGVSVMEGALKDHDKVS